MINLKVFKLTEIIKYFTKIIIVILLIVGIFKLIYSTIEKTSQNPNGIIRNRISIIPKETLIKYMNNAFPVYISNQNDVEKINLKFSANGILKFELEMLNTVIEKSDLQIVTKDLSSDDIDELLSTEESKTEVIASSVKESYNLENSGVKVSNKSRLELTPEILNPDFEPANIKDIIIYHTHTCESYTPTDTTQYVPSGNFRTRDLNYSVARVGDELTTYLNKFKFNVIHDKTYHDYPAYSGSYENSYKTVSNIVNGHPGTEIIFDIHRDAVGSDNSYAPTVKIGEEYVAQIMFVIGTNGGGLEHNNWKYNLKTAIKIQQKANELYPGLFRPITVRDSRYNQNLGNSASILEVGATGNTIEQCENSMKYLSIVLNELWGKSE